MIIDRPRLLILTTPNVGFTVPRLMLLFGQFNYGQTSILDRTYTRLFRFSPSLFSYQIFLGATVTPDVVYVPASTRTSVKDAAA